MNDWATSGCRASVCSSSRTRRPSLRLSDDLLKRSGCVARLRRTGKTARQAFAEGDFDLILLDLRLPDVFGLTLLEEFRAQDGPPVVVVSANAFDEDRERSLAGGLRRSSPSHFIRANCYRRFGVSEKWTKKPQTQHVFTTVRGTTGR